MLVPAQRWALLGGDHTTTASVVEVALEHYPDLRVVQFDAHPDLRGEYLGEAWNYASAMTRVLDHLGPDRLYQIGLRTGDREEWEPPRGTHVFPGWAGSAADAAASIAGELSGQPLYVTIDIDVLDPSIAPGTGAPEPGGITRARSPRGAPAPRRRAGDRLRRGGGLPALGPVGPDGDHGRRDRARRDPDVVGAAMTPRRAPPPRGAVRRAPLLPHRLRAQPEDGDRLPRRVLPEVRARRGPPRPRRGLRHRPPQPAPGPARLPHDRARPVGARPSRSSTARRRGSAST